MRINISLESEVIKIADRLAQNYGLSRSSLISYLITKSQNSRTFGYTWEKLHSAMLSLTSDGEEWQRIGYAYMSIHTLNKNDFPEHLHNKYDNLMNLNNKYNNKEFLEQKNMSGEFGGLFFFSAKNMSDNERRECRYLFISLHDSITRYQPEVLF